MTHISLLNMNTKCPISHETMTNPYITVYGNSYEYENIKLWLESHNTDPLTSQSLTMAQIFPNRALKELIESGGIQNNDDEQLVKPATIEYHQDLFSQTHLEIYDGHENYLNISIKIPDSTHGIGSHYCVVVDISGSMAQDATMKNASGQTESHGLTILDIVKHAVRTIIENLSENDKMSIVSFSTTANVVASFVTVDSFGKQQLNTALDSLRPEATTNLWDGIYKGLELIRRGKHNGNNHMFVLTDGVPNVEPPRGHMYMVKKYFEINKLKCSINTFGFGYNLDSQLLYDISKESFGMFSFIPEPSMVGTIFINSLANAKCSMTTSGSLNLETNNSEIEEIIGTEYTKTSWGANIKFGTMCYGQSKDIVIKMKTANIKECINCTFMFSDPFDGTNREVSTKSIINNTQNLIHNLHRVKFVEKVSQINNLCLVNNFYEGKQILDSFILEIQRCDNSSDILKDLVGQVSEAILRDDWYHKWGKHYLLSLICAHQNQVCNNFKDPGVQKYGGELFIEYRDKADDVFCKLAPPKPTGRTTKVQIGSMSTYHSSGNPCFAETCMVKMEDGSVKQIKDLEPFNVVKTDKGSSKIKCILRFKCTENKIKLSKIDSLLVTPWHPIKYNNEWTFPTNIEKEKLRYCEYIYSFVLENDHIMIIENYECVCLGHDFTGGVIGHEYFGSSKVIEDLKQFEGFNIGLIDIDETNISKSKCTGLFDRIIKL